MTDSRIRSTVRQILRWLAEGDFSAVEGLAQGVRLSASEMAEAVAEYGRTLVVPPEDELDGLDVVEVEGSSPKAWSVRVPLWTVEEGRSDLEVDCTFVDQPGGLLRTEIDNLHVP